MLNSNVTDIKFRDRKWYQTKAVTTIDFKWSKFELQMQLWYTHEQHALCRVDIFSCQEWKLQFIRNKRISLKCKQKPAKFVIIQNATRKFMLWNNTNSCETGSYGFITCMCVVIYSEVSYWKCVAIWLHTLHCSNWWENEMEIKFVYSFIHS